MSDAALAALQGGRLEDCLKLGQDAARREPAKVEHRMLLFHLFTLTGDWRRAVRQLDIVADLEPKRELFCALYRPLPALEAVRAEVFMGKKEPMCLGQPPAWFARLVEALRLDAQREHVAAKRLRDEAFAQADAVPGSLDGTAFAWLADADERLGPVLETMVEGRYLWIPLERVRRLEIGAPKGLRDLVWLPVRITLANEGTAAGFVPARYPGSEASEDAGLRLARQSVWRQLGEGSWTGLGQRMLATDAGEHALLDCRLVELDAPPSAGAAAHD
jgi:type VI secretion system protein ImpE